MCLSNLTQLDTGSTNGVNMERDVCPNNGKCSVFEKRHYFIFFPL